MRPIKNAKGIGMSFRFESANCVAVGAFNIYIVQPHWLGVKGILPPDLELEIESSFDEPGFRFRSKDLQVKWVVTPTRIVIETDRPDEDCGKIMADLLAFLPETPLKAIGNNTHFSCGRESLEVPEVPNFPSQDGLPGYDLKQRAFQFAVSSKNCVYSAQLTLTEEKAMLLTNAHGQISGNDGMKFAQNHARGFLEHRQISCDLAKHYLKVDFDV